MGSGETDETEEITAGLRARPCGLGQATDMLAALGWVSFSRCTGVSKGIAVMMGPCVDHTFEGVFQCA
jgi:hypothetical protein